MDESCTTCSTPGIFALQRRLDPGTGDDRWEFKRISKDNIETPDLVSLDWGSSPYDSEDSPLMTAIYAGAAAGGTWAAELSW
jgi:hypothetical protein